MDQDQHCRTNNGVRARIRLFLQHAKDKSKTHCTSRLAIENTKSNVNASTSKRDGGGLLSQLLFFRPDTMSSMRRSMEAASMEVLMV